MKRFAGVQSLIFAAFLALSVFHVSDAMACGRCGLFGNRCRFAVVTPHHAHAAVVEPVVVNRDTPVIITNVFPQANGAALLAPQGSTGYTYGGFQQSAQAYTVNPAEALRYAQQLAGDANDLAKTGLNGYMGVASLALQLKAQTDIPLAQGLAATSVLNAAGLSGNGPQQLNAGPTSIKIYRDASGQWKVEMGEPQQLNSGGGHCDKATARQPATDPTTDPSAPQGDQAAPALGSSIVAAKCGSCHGKSMAEPAKGLYFDAGYRLDCQSAMRAINAVRSGKMPKSAREKPLTAEERYQLIEELSSLVSGG